MKTIPKDETADVAISDAQTVVAVCVVPASIPFESPGKSLVLSSVLLGAVAEVATESPVNRTL